MVPLGVVIISMFALISLCISHYTLTEPIFSWEVCSISLLWMSYSTTESPYSLECICDISLPPLFALPCSYFIYSNKHLHSMFLNFLYIVLFFKVFYCFLISVNHIAFHLQHCNTWNQHHIYTIVDKISSVLFFLSLSTRESKIWQ